MSSIYYYAGLRIKGVREKRHYTREKLAEMAGISAKFLYEIEGGKKGFSADTLYKLAEALEISSDYILYGETRDRKDKKLIHVLEKFKQSQSDSLVEINELIYKISKNNH